MLKTLIKARLSAFWAGLGFDKKTGKKRSVGKLVLFGFLYVYLIAVFLGLFLGAFFLLGTLTLQTEMAWLYFAAAGLLAVLLAVVGTVFGTVTQLYEAKDNDLLLSMPIPPKYILLSRLLTLLLGNVAFEAVVLLPAFVMYFVVGLPFGAISPWGILSLLAGMLVLPFVSLTFSCLFGWLVAQLLRRVRRKSLVQTVFSLALLGLYFYFYGKMMTGADSLENISLILHPLANAVKTYFYPFYLFGLGCAGNVGAGLLSLLFAAIPAFLVFWILAKSFINIATAKTALKKTEYREKTMKRSSPRRTLVKNNLSHLFHSSGYLLNSAIGLFMLLVGAVALLVGKDAFLSSFLSMDGMEGAEEITAFLTADALAALLTAMVCFLASMVMITAPSISIEAKTIWILRSSPLTGRDVLLSKVYASELLSVPVLLIVSVAVIVVAAPVWYVALGVLLLPQLFALFGALFGMIVGVAFPRFNWNNETEAVKQGMAVFLAMFGMMGISVAAIGIGFILSILLGAGAALLLLSLLFLGLSLLLLWIMLSVSARKFEKIQV